MNGPGTGGSISPAPTAKSPSLVSAKPKITVKSPVLFQHLSENNQQNKLDQSSSNKTIANDGIQRTKSIEKPSIHRSSSITDSAQRVQIQHYLHVVSGQLKQPLIHEVEHNYAKPCHIHPDPQIRAQPAKYLFMKHFPNDSSDVNSNDIEDDLVDVVSFEETKKIPFLTPKPPPQQIVVDDDRPDIDRAITDLWTNEQNQLWTRAVKILSSDRLARLSYDGHVNEVMLKRNLQEHTANKIRELLGSTFWDIKQINWLHQTLMDHLDPNFQTIYVDSLHILSQKIPTLIDKFFKIENKNKINMFNDPLFNTLSHYKPKKLPRKPVFILVPNGPNQPVNPSPRYKYWTSLLSAMGKLIQISVPGKPEDYVIDILADIRIMVNEKIKNIKSSLACRPIILVGFNSGAMIAAHCALQNPKAICAVVCLGFPLKTINGIRGELGDTLLELTCPIQFIIGENSMTATLDDIESFREQMTRTETNLVVVGGADDRLVVSHTKKQLECLTQSMVDRCVVDEIYSFLNPLLLNYTDENLFIDDPRFGFAFDEHNQLLPIPKKPSAVSNRKRLSEDDPEGIHDAKPPRKKSRPKPKNGFLFSNNNNAEQKPKDPSQFFGPNFTFVPIQKPASVAPPSKSIELKTVIKRQPPIVSPLTPETIGGNEPSPSLFRLTFPATTTKQVSNSETINGSNVGKNPTPTGTPEPKCSASKDSYTISEVSSLHVSSTRTGRQIKPPKALDI